MADLYKDSPAEGTPQAVATPPPADVTKTTAAPEASKEASKAEAPKETPKASANEETKKVETTEQKQAAPEKYDLKMPDGSLLDADAVAKIADFAKSANLSNEQAQAILERENAAVSTYAEAQKASFKQVTESWVNTAKADKEIGGDAFKENVELAKRVVDRYGTDDFKKTLDETGLGNNPELLRVFARIGKVMGNDKLVHPSSKSVGNRMSPEQVLYGNKQS